MLAEAMRALRVHDEELFALEALVRRLQSRPQALTVGDDGDAPVEDLVPAAEPLAPAEAAT